ncbi:hypothetical protein, partial [Mesorhizobium sp. NBIMC_P2-C2]|uniref:hypothetical protein n=1 Tax=Mesorhizobium sp. NBIMC_P2-C2 TaxID=1320557 RepID=UPI0019553CFF
ELKGPVDLSKGSNARGYAEGWDKAVILPLAGSGAFETRKAKQLAFRPLRGPFLTPSSVSALCAEPPSPARGEGEFRIWSFTPPAG